MAGKILRNRWSLTRESFDMLLARLSPVRETAAERFEALRRRLILFFTYRRCATPDRWADETLDRAAKRLIEGKQLDDIPAFLYGAARLVLLEARKEEAREREALSNIPDPPDSKAAAVRAVCLEQCLAQLPTEQRTLIERYYGGDGKRLAEARSLLKDDLKISADSLRSRALRIRRTLEQCAGECRERRDYGDTFAKVPPLSNEGESVLAKSRKREPNK